MASNKSCSILVTTKMVLMLVMVLMVFTPILVNAFSNLYGPDSNNQAEQYNAYGCSAINTPTLVNPISSSLKVGNGPGCNNQAERYHAGGYSAINAPILNNVISGSCAVNAPVLNNVISGSSITVWAGPGCNNLAVRHNVCGCSDINLHGGYYFSFGGQSAAMYNQAGCTGVSHFRFHADASGCHPFGWLSIFIQC